MGDDPLDYIGAGNNAGEIKGIIHGGDSAPLTAFDRTSASLNESKYMPGPGKEKKKKRRRDKGKNDNDEVTDMVFGAGDVAEGDSPGKGKVRMDKKKKKRRDKNKNRQDDVETVELQAMTM